MRLWHPEPEGGALFDLGGYNAEVLTGPAAYQVTDGDTVTL